MPAPDFVIALREKIGHDHLWLSGVTVYVLNKDRTHCLFVQRADNRAWTPVTGIIDPGEAPARAGAREVLEETGCTCEIEFLSNVGCVGPVTHPNGDVASYLDLAFVATHVEGDPHPADGENLQAAWFPIGEPPKLNSRFTKGFRHALAQVDSGEHVAKFER